MKKLTVFAFMLSLVACQPKTDVQVQDIDDNLISISESQQENWVVLNYWASWCSPCITEIPELNQLNESFNTKVKVLAINPELTDKVVLKDQAKKLNIQYPVLTSDPGPALGLEPVQALPATYLIGPNGQVKGPFLGAQTMASLSKEMSLVAQP